MAEGGGDKSRPIYWLLMTEDERKAYIEIEEWDKAELRRIEEARNERSKSR